MESRAVVAEADELARIQSAWNYLMVRSSPRKRGPRRRTLSAQAAWIPACAGMSGGDCKQCTCDRTGENNNAADEGGRRRRPVPAGPRHLIDLLPARRAERSPVQCH